MSEATGLALDAANLIAMLTGNVIYGAFTVMFITSVYVLINKRKTPRPNWPLLGVAVSMFVLSTTILAISWSRILDAFIVYRDTLTPDGYFEEVNSWKEVTRTALICVYLLVADGALVYRCWIVWSRSLLIIAFPLCLFTADIVVVFTLVATMVKTTSTSVFVDTIARWVTAVVSFTLAQNIIVTGLIVYKILSVNRLANQYNGSNLTPIVAVLIESGMLYVLTLFIFLMSYVAKSNAQWILIDALNPVIGLAFTMLIVRVGLGLTATQSGHESSFYRSHQSHAMQPIAISVSRRVDLDNQIQDNDESSDFVERKHSTLGKSGSESA